MTIENPHLPDNFEEMLQHLPTDHPARNKNSLTVLQSFALPILMWFFDKDKYVGQGRSTLAAHILIRLAMKGNTVEISDLSLASYNLSFKINKAIFLSTLCNVMERDYKRYRFEINKANMQLKFIGIR